MIDSWRAGDGKSESVACLASVNGALSIGGNGESGGSKTKEGLNYSTRTRTVDILSGFGETAKGGRPALGFLL